MSEPTISDSEWRYPFTEYDRGYFHAGAATEVDARSSCSPIEVAKSPELDSLLLAAQDLAG